MKITELNIGDVVQELDTSKIYTVSTLAGNNPSYPIVFKECKYANWSLSHIQGNFIMISPTGWYEIY
jgi:hypothetical protein